MKINNISDVQSYQHGWFYRIGNRIVLSKDAPLPIGLVPIPGTKDYHFKIKIHKINDEPKTAEIIKYVSYQIEGWK